MSQDALNIYATLLSRLAAVVADQNYGEAAQLASQLSALLADESNAAIQRQAQSALQNIIATIEIQQQSRSKALFDFGHKSRRVAAYRQADRPH